MEFWKSTPISLKSHPVYNEKWLQSLLAEDPSLLGLGDLVVRDIERRQPRAGRLDLLLSDPETNTRYEVAIGATDETHIIRTVEYWDIEKGRYPQYEHVSRNRRRGHREPLSQCNYSFQQGNRCRGVTS